jgi:thioredoxin-dependent peroxiredoxin
VVEEGKPAPDFELESDSGNRVRLSSLRGRPVVPYFYPESETNRSFRSRCTLGHVSGPLFV